MFFPPQFVVLFAPSYYQLLLFYLYVDHDKRYVFHKITHLSITRTLVLIFPLPSSTSCAVQAQLAVQGPWCQIAEDILVAVTNCLLVGCAECCSGSIRVVYVSVTWLGSFNARWFCPPPPAPTLFPLSSMHFPDLPWLPSEGGFAFTWQWAYGDVSPALRTGICRVKGGFCSQCHTCFPIQTYRLPLQPPTSRLATHLCSERLNESRQNCTAFLTHRNIVHFNGMAG